MQSSAPCAVCNGGGHSATRCPELAAPLRSGFVPKTGGPNYGGDDEDDSIRMIKVVDNTTKIEKPLITVVVCA
jgi:hypothetical protein